MSSIFEVRLKSIKLLENGTVDDGEKGNNALGSILFYPRSGVPAVNSVRPMALHDNEGMIFTGKPYDQQVLFKEEVTGETQLTFEVSAIDKPDRIDEVITGLLGTAVAVAAGGAGSAIFGAVAKSLTGTIFGAIGPKKKVDVIARGVFSFDENFPGGEITLALQVPKNVTIKDLKLGPDGEPRRKKKTLKKGAPNGKLVLDIRRL